VPPVPVPVPPVPPVPVPVGGVTLVGPTPPSGIAPVFVFVAGIPTQVYPPPVVTPVPTVPAAT
jgi:hypothetical protein